MKNLFTLMLLALMWLICSCSNNDLGSSLNSSDPIDFRITTTLPSSMQTRGDNSALGGINNVDKTKYDLRYICEVWTKETTPRLAYRSIKTTNDFGQQMEFSARLLQMEYDFVFWADFVIKGSTSDLFYETNNLMDIKIQGIYGISDDARDAYYAKQTINLSTTGANVTGIILKRPFGKIRIVASDAGNTILPEKPVKASVRYTATKFPGGFNALTGQVTDETISVDNNGDAFVVKAQKIDDFMIGTAHYGTCYVIAYDYIFASEAMPSIAFNLKIFSDEEGTLKIGEKDISAIPIAANKLTTIIGNLYTVEGKMKIVVTDPFENEEISPVAAMDVNNISAINSALIGAANTNNSIKLNVTETVTGINSITIPDLVMASNTPTVSLNFTSIDSGTVINITDATPSNSLNNYDGNLYVSIPDGMPLSELKINVPKAHVVVYGSYGQIIAKTSPSTFIVPVGTKIDDLKIEGGNVEIYGAVTMIARKSENQDLKTIVYLFDNVVQPSSDNSDGKIEFVRVISGAIKNITKNTQHTTIKEAVNAADAGNIIELSNGSYPLTVDAAKVTSNQDDYLRINKNLTIRGGVGEVIIYGETVIKGGNGSTQSTIFIGNNASVKFENLTFMPHVNTYYAPGNTNKTIEVLSGANLNAINCKFVPNTKVSGYTTTGGALYFAQSTGTINDCIFDKAAFSVDGLMSGVLNINNCSFDKGFISTVNWTSNDVTKSTMVINVNNSKFTNTNQAGVPESRIVRASFGTININKCTFPEIKGVYTQAADFGKVYVDYASNLSPDWTNDRTQPKEFAIANNIVTMVNNSGLSQSQTFYSWQGRKVQPKLATLSAMWEIETSLKVVDQENSVKSVWLFVEDNSGTQYYLSMAYIQTPDKATGWYIYNSSKQATSATWYEEWDNVEVAAKTDAFNAVKFVANGSSIDMLINGIKVSTYHLSESATASRVINLTFNSRNVANSVNYTSTWTYPTLK